MLPESTCTSPDAAIKYNDPRIWQKFRQDRIQLREQLYRQKRHRLLKARLDIQRQQRRRQEQRDEFIRRVQEREQLLRHQRLIQQEIQIQEEFAQVYLQQQQHENELDSSFISTSSGSSTETCEELEEKEARAEVVEALFMLRYQDMNFKLSEEDMKDIDKYEADINNNEEEFDDEDGYTSDDEYSSDEFESEDEEVHVTSIYDYKFECIPEEIEEDLNLIINNWC